VTDTDQPSHGDIGFAIVSIYLCLILVAFLAYHDNQRVDRLERRVDRLERLERQR
jgi:hypothetical protein